MSLFDTQYNSNGSTNNSGSDSDSEDYEDRRSLKLGKYGIVSFELDSLSTWDGGNYGTSLIVDVNDVKVIDGMVYDRTKGNDDDTIKVFGYDKWFQTDGNGQLEEEVTDKLVNHRITEEFGGTQYPYEFLDRTTQDDDPVELGDMTMWLSNGTKNRTFAKVVTPQGHDIINEKNDNHNWLARDDPQIRDDLEGRRLILFYEKDSFNPDDADEPVEFTDAVILDEETRAGITIKNGSSSSSGNASSSSGSESEASSSGSVGGNGSLPEGVPDELDDIIGFIARTGDQNAENVQQLVQSELNDDTSMDDVDLDAVMAEIENRS